MKVEYLIFTLVSYALGGGAAYRIFRNFPYFPQANKIQIKMLIFESFLLQLYFYEVNLFGNK